MAYLILVQPDSSQKLTSTIPFHKSYTLCIFSKNIGNNRESPNKSGNCEFCSEANFNNEQWANERTEIQAISCSKSKNETFNYPLYLITMIKRHTCS